MIALLLGALGALLANFLPRVLFGAGLSLTAYHFIVQPMIDRLESVANSGTADFLQWAGLLKIDEAITVICSAYVIRFTSKALTLSKAS